METDTVTKRYRITNANAHLDGDDSAPRVTAIPELEGLEATLNYDDETSAPLFMVHGLDGVEGLERLPDSDTFWIEWDNVEEIL